MTYNLDKEYNKYLDFLDKNIAKIKYIDDNYSTSYIHVSDKPLHLWRFKTPIFLLKNGLK